jgi:hypothetical protein
MKATGPFSPDEALATTLANKRIIAVLSAALIERGVLDQAAFCSALENEAGAARQRHSTLGEAAAVEIEQLADGLRSIGQTR